MLNDEPRFKIAIGTDIIEIERFRNLDIGSPFYSRVFSEVEVAYCMGFSEPASHFAVTFAGKEAVAKATNSNCSATLRNIEILRTNDGAPHVRIHKSCDFDVYVSLAHSSTYAVAAAIAVHQSYESNMNEIQEMLEQTVIQLLPEGEVS